MKHGRFAYKLKYKLTMYAEEEYVNWYTYNLCELITLKTLNNNQLAMKWRFANWLLLAELSSHHTLHYLKSYFFNYWPFKYFKTIKFNLNGFRWIRDNRSTENPGSLHHVMEKMEVDNDIVVDLSVRLVFFFFYYKTYL